MTREELLSEILSIDSTNILLELATGSGKSRIALELVRKYSSKNVLIVVNRLVHIDNWKDECIKWGVTFTPIFTTYASVEKYAGSWDCVIFDECHHITERVEAALAHFEIGHAILLSATVPNDARVRINSLFNPVSFKRSLRNVIDDDILPDPVVYLIPLKLDTVHENVSFLTDKKSKTGKVCRYNERWTFIKKGQPVMVKCTEKQYAIELDKQCEYWKKRYLVTKTVVMKNKWLRACSDRLKWLSDRKGLFIRELLKHLDSYRTLTFCNNIEQTERYGSNYINSKDKASQENLRKFNAGEVNHITACNILNEGMNLYDCQVGIYANLNSSDIIVKQRMGRLLRHPKPVIIIPYYKYTREEELVSKMLESCNPELVKVVKSIKEIDI